MPERQYEISSSRGAAVWTTGPLVFRFHGRGHLWIGTEEDGGICSLSPTKAAALIDFLQSGGEPQ